MKKVLFGCLGAVTVLAGVSALLIWLWLFRELPKLEATISLPSEVELESMFSMDITASNGHKRTITLDSIDVDVGHFSGDVDVCNPNQDFKTLLADVVIKNRISNSTSDGIRQPADESPKPSR